MNIYWPNNIEDKALNYIPPSSNFQRKKKQLEEKMARYSYLIGNTLGKSDLTMQQVRQLQDESYSQIATAALRETQVLTNNTLREACL